MPPSSPTRGEIHSPALTQRHSSSFPVAPNRPFPFRQRSTASEPPSSPPPKPPPPAPPSPISIHLLAHFALFSILGTLARLGLTALFSYPGQAVFALIWAQGVGCFLMGCLTGRKSDVEKVLGTVGFVALSTGLCGSITTFSSWMLQTFEVFSNLDGFARSGVYDAADGLAQIILTAAFSLFSFHLGRHLVQRLPFLPCHPPSPKPLPFPDSSPQRPSHPYPKLLLLSTSFSLALYLLALLLLLLLPSSFHPGRRILFALVLAPPGTYLRYLLSRYLNPLSKSFPVLGTLAANLLATTVLSVCFLLQRLEGFGGSATTLVQCQTMQAFEDGFCGCLSTVSTFVSELDSLSNAPPKAVSNGAAAGREDEKGGKGGEEGETVREWFREGGTWRAWAYFGMSVFLGVAIVVLVVGSGRWAKSGGLGAACRY